MKLLYEFLDEQKIQYYVHDNHVITPRRILGMDDFPKDEATLRRDIDTFRRLIQLTEKYSKTMDLIKEVASDFSIHVKLEHNSKIAENAMKFEYLENYSGVVYCDAVFKDIPLTTSVLSNGQSVENWIEQNRSLINWSSGPWDKSKTKAISVSRHADALFFDEAAKASVIQKYANNLLVLANPMTMVVLPNNTESIEIFEKTLRETERYASIAAFEILADGLVELS